jgi:hypothetical protein
VLSGRRGGFLRRPVERAMQIPNGLRTGPDDTGHFGIYGGRHVAETPARSVR